MMALVLLTAPAGTAPVADRETDTEPMQTQTLLDFEPTDTRQWYVINDGVMGGVSRSDIEGTGRGTGIFSGVLSLENNGGFASVRAVVGPRDLSAHDGLQLRVKGDGRRYQLRLRVNDRFDGVAYRSHFNTVQDEWIEVTLPFADFQPTFRGRVLPDQPPLDTRRIAQLTFMLADKQPGPFQLEIDHVKTWRAPREES
jgi:monofunctional biosynthetic peptidoglycan transglycosylase